MFRFRSDSGSAAVEFALVVPLLITLVLGIVEFGRAYNVQGSLSAAAREGVRVMAVSNSPTAARAATKNAAVLNPAITDAQVTISPASCTPASNVTLTITYPLAWVTGFFPGSLTLKGKGVMRCGG
jgi:Flp pilus assembly protein TadG